VDLIVTHNNADFDAFSSLVAAKKLYPRAKLLMPGSQERAVREFLSLVKDEITFEKERTCNLDNIKRLILVDTRHKSRIGVASKLLDDPSVEVHIYDHHPRMSSDIKGDKDIFQEVGGTVSILVDLLRKKNNAKFTPLEATIMLLGIYEETGSLTYRTTTKLDVDTVAFLLSKGANLQAVSSYLNRKLTEEELAFLTSLITSTKVIPISGINVAIAEGTIKRFIGELGTIVRKLQDVENLPVLFVFFKIRNKIRIIARSRLKEIDVNLILKRFGGGGHRSAASAKVESGDIKKYKEKLTEILKTTIKTKVFAKDIMSFPVRTIPSDKKIKETRNILKKNKLKGAPVVAGKKIVGVITIGDIKKAMRYRYDHASVKGYMSRKIISIKPNTPLHVVQKMMFENGIGRLPVLRGSKLVGIVTRTDVLKSVHRDIFTKHKFSKRRSESFNISAKMSKILPSGILNLLRTIGKCANRVGMNAFVVGGFVRDMLLGVGNFDIDIVVEGDAISLGRKIASICKGSLVVYKKFGTATVIMDWPKGVHKPSNSKARFKIDFATAREESYEKPAALPTVKFSSLREDLRRRDFTINAMAASLSKGSFGQLIDFFGGEKDIERKTIRVLHDGSFIDDPTRIFRAVRFEQRFKFRIDKYTQGLIKHAVKEGMFSRTQKQRIRDEIVLMLKEENPVKAILRMKELHELRFIHKKIRVNKNTETLFKRIKESFIWYNKSVSKTKHIDLWLIYLMALLETLKVPDIKCLNDKFIFQKRDRVKLLSCAKNNKRILKTLSVKKLNPSQIHSILSNQSLEEILFLRAEARKKDVLSNIERFLIRHDKVKIQIGGEELKKLGLKPGPLYTKLLKGVLHQRIDGKIKTKNDEINFVKRSLRKND